MARPPLHYSLRVLSLLFSVSLGSALAGDDDPITAIPVSPGTQEVGALIGDPCPSFSWGAVDGAQRYELAIFDAQWQDSPAYDEQQRQGAPLRQIEIAAPALSWTPAGRDCLDEGGSYLWFVRAQTADADSPWSAPRYFEIDYDADALTQTVRRELAAQLSRPEVWREVIQAALSSNAHLRLMPLNPEAVVPTREANGTESTGAGTDLPKASVEQMTTVSATTFPNPAALKIDSPNGVVFSNTANGGGIPAEGAGLRFMWYPGKAALRAGSVTSTQWDNANVGIYSTAIGLNTTASGDFSMAMGRDTTASGYASTAIGSGTTASYYYSVAMGYLTTASSEYSMAMGYSTKASGLAATAMGYSTMASNVSSMAMGNFSEASGKNSMAIGDKTKASGNSSTAMGRETTASGDYSTAIGYDVTAQSYAETVIGRYNTSAVWPSPGSWKTLDRLFVIGNGNSPTKPSDALVVLKNGNVGIGTSTPTYRLQLGTDSAGKPGGGTWTNSSDARLKAITGPYDSGLAEIAALQPVRYHYAEGNARGHDPAPEYVGFIAQQVQPVFPEAVSEGNDGYLDFNMHAVNVAMVNAIQTLSEQNLALGAQLQTQTEQLQTLRERNQEQGGQLQLQEAQIAALRADKAALAQRLVDQEDRNALQEQRLVTLEAENAHHARLQADLGQLQAQMQVLQGQMAADTYNARVALGR